MSHAVLDGTVLCLGCSFHRERHSRALSFTHDAHLSAHFLELKPKINVSFHKISAQEFRIFY